MISSEVLKAVRHIDLRTRKAVSSSFVGAYHSVFKGRGREFDAVRPYQPGDDIRSIDWNVTARSGGEPFVKEYIEERELTVLIMLDVSASSLFGSVKQRKRDMGAELGAVLSYSAMINHDKVSLLLFSDQVELYLPPRKGRKHFLRLIRELLMVKAANTGTDIALALQTVNRLQRQRAIVFLISDFLAPVENYSRELAITSYKHEVIPIVVSDPLEQTWGDVGLMTLQDAEDGSYHWIDTSQKGWTGRFELQTKRFRGMRDAAFESAEVDRITIRLDENYIGSLLEFFQKRAQRLKK